MSELAQSQEISTAPEAHQPPLIPAESGARHHLAIMSGNYLEKILRGEKTIESRFSRIACPPYKAVAPGDVVLFKHSGGTVRAKAEVLSVVYYAGLTPDRVANIVADHSGGLALEPDFIQTKAEARYATLIFLHRVELVSPLSFPKRDRRGWVVLADTQVPLASFDQSKTNRRRRYTGSKLKPWSRTTPDHVNPESPEGVFRELRTNEWRRSWWDRELDERSLRQLHRATESVLLERIRKRLTSAVGGASPYRDGMQTPYTGNVIYYAQHALALCCRKCIADWYGLPRDRELTPDELELFTALVAAFIQDRRKGIVSRLTH